jgi:hypothetical protein
MKKIIALSVFVLITLSITAQNYVTRNGYIRFYSKAPLENIEAVNNVVNCVINSNNGDFVFRVLMRSFTFEKALMQEHFNDNYVESHKYPNASFQGKIKNISEINFSVPKVYDVIVEGDLTIKNITKQVSHKGTLDVRNDEVIGQSTFTIKVADYNITIPSTLIRNIASEIEITVKVNLKKM